MDITKEDRQTFVITKEDVGRQVVDGYGDVETIRAWHEGDVYPVETNGSYYTSKGFFGSRPDSSYNLVGFVEEEKEKEMEIVKEDKEEVMKVYDSRDYTREECEELLEKGDIVKIGCLPYIKLTEGTLIYKDYDDKWVSSNISGSSLPYYNETFFKEPNRDLRYKSVSELMEEGWKFDEDGWLVDPEESTSIDPSELRYLGNILDDTSNKIIVGSKGFKLITKEV